MKTAYLTLLCAFLGAGSASASAWLNPKPSPQITGQKAPLAAPHSALPGVNDPYLYTLEFQALYGFAAGGEDYLCPDTFGFELEAVKYLTPKQAITCSLGFMAGGEERTTWAAGYRHNWDYDRSSINLMVGYRFMHSVNERLRFNFGLKAGLDVQMLGVKDNYRYHSSYWDDYDSESSRAGLAYAGYANVSYSFSPRWNLVLGYQYYGATTKPETRAIYVNEPPYQGKSMGWHQIKLGVSFDY